MVFTLHAIRKGFIVLNFVLALPLTFSQSTQDQLVSRGMLQTRLSEFGGSDAQREATLKKLFEESGCSGERLSEQRVNRLKEPNLTCTLPGQSNSVILVGAHFDHVRAGDGVVDNWSGAALLPSLVQSMRGEALQHTFVFVGFAGEEKGLVGSAFYAKQLSPAQRDLVKAVVNIDTLGLSPTKVWVSHADWDLFKLLERVAYRLDLPLAGINVEGVGSTDSESFAKLRIPVITIHSVTQETWPILHSKRDKLDAINLNDYYTSYRLLAAYLRAVDTQFGPPANTPRPSK